MRFPWFLVLLPALAAIPAFGQESVMTLAMVSYDQSPVRTAAVARHGSATNSPGYTSAPCLAYRITGLNFDSRNALGLSSAFRFNKQDNFSPRDWSRIVYRKSNADGQTWVWTHVEAGYGQFCRFESSLGEKALEMEQPSCAYLRASFSF
jgi:hypothetical protein